ncbi:MAG: PHP domain-containing protein, partial [Rhodospirillales bacterium]|nr:PHP domain-containing protein [Acetobacter sp.]
MTERYVELHARSAFSFLEGASLPEAMTQQAANLELPGLAILDRDGLYGSPRLYTTAEKHGLRSHVGAEISVDGFGQQLRPPAWQPHTVPDRPVRLSLLCESQTGYRNLSMLISGYKLAQRTKGDGVAPLRKLEEHAGGLVCLTGGHEGPLAAALERGGMDEARTTLKRLVRIFGPQNIFVELQRHGICEQEARNQAAIALSRELQLPLLATNGVNMATAFEREILDVFTAIRHGCSLDAAGMLLEQNSKRHLRSAKEMLALFRDVPEAIANTGELSDRLSFRMNNMGYEFPHYPIPSGETTDSFLRKRTMEGVARRYGCKLSAELRSKAEMQVKKELALIAKLGLAGYFLIVWNIVEFCGENGILVQGRGSAANSAVCYALGI